MNRYTIEHNGRRFVVEAPDDATALRLVTGQGSAAPAAPAADMMGPPTQDEAMQRTVAGEIDREEQAANRSFLGRTERGTRDMSRLASQGQSFGFLDELAAVATTPLEMIQRGTLSPSEGYGWAKVRQNELLRRARDRQGALGTGAEILGGIAAIPASGGLGATQGPVQGSRVLANLMTPSAPVGASAGRMAFEAGRAGAIQGGLTGIGEGSGLEDRLTRGATSAAIGGLAGGAISGLASGASAALRPMTSNVQARMNPEAYARNEIAARIAETGRSADDIQAALRQAAQEGQGVYTLADELGEVGQRSLASVSNATGPGRAMVERAMQNRVADAPRRVQGIIEDGLGVTRTANAERAARRSDLRVQDNVNYTLAREGAGAANPTAAIQLADDFLNPGMAGGVMRNASDIADDSIEAAVNRFRNMLTDRRGNVLTNFDQLQRQKIEMDRVIKRAALAQDSNLVRVLAPIRNAVDDSLAAASPGYAAARDASRRARGQIDAIQTGTDAARRGRSEDTIGAFRRMPQDQQQPFRVGYADRLVEDVQSRAVGPAANPVMPLNAPATRQELAAIAPLRTSAQMGRQIDRENVMALTNQRSRFNSATAANQNEGSAVGLGSLVELGKGVASGGMNAVGAVARFAGNAWNGYTPAVREAMARYLLMTGNSPQRAGEIMIQAAQNLEFRRMLENQVMRAVLSGGAAGSQSTASRSTNAPPRPTR